MNPYNHNFAPSGYPIQDKCKICGEWCITVVGLRERGLDILRSGSLSARVREDLLEDRSKAIAHGVIQEHQFPIAVLDKAIALRKEVEKQSFSDMDIDNDSFKSDKGKGTFDKTEAQEKITDLSLVEAGDLVFVGRTSTTSLGKRRSSILLGKNAYAKMVKVKDLVNKREAWVKISLVWKLSGGKQQEKANQFSLWGEDFDLSEALIPYVGMH